MQKTFRITVEGRSYNVVVEDLTDQVPHPAPSATPVAAVDGVAVARPAVVPPPAPAAPEPTAAAAGPGAVVAPLAGVIYAIDVRVGQEVKPGDQIATIEAMKMKTYVLAKAAGTVGSIAVKVQDSVETGQVLLTLT
jgi:biotin carboxyl carrier protein